MLKSKKIISCMVSAITALTLMPAFFAHAAVEAETEIHTVTFRDDNSVFEVQRVAHGESADEPDEPDRDGYTFIGWNRPFDNVTEDITVTAQWELDEDEDDDADDEGEEDEDDEDKDEYTVIFIDRTKVVKTQTVRHGKPAKAPKLKRRGYTHTGWDSKFAKVKEDMVICAKWKSKTVKLTFHANGGRVASKNTKSIHSKYGGQIRLAKKPVRKGYVFRGWYTKRYGGRPIDKYAKVSLTSKTYYARWKKKQIAYSRPASQNRTVIFIF